MRVAQSIRAGHVTVAWRRYLPICSHARNTRTKARRSSRTATRSYLLASSVAILADSSSSAFVTSRFTHGLASSYLEGCNALTVAVSTLGAWEPWHTDWLASVADVPSISTWVASTTNMLSGNGFLVCGWPLDAV